MFIQIFTGVESYIIVNVSEISTVENKRGNALVTLRDGRVLETAERFDVLLGNLNAALPEPIGFRVSPEA